MAMSRRDQRRVQTLVILLVIFYFLYKFISRLASDPVHPSGSHAVLDAATEARGEEKELVVASLIGDDTSWLDEFFDDWKKNIYVVNNQSAPLTVPKNKGREAMPFLTYASAHLLHYSSIPSRPELMLTCF
jgi:hypothetical protein